MTLHIMGMTMERYDDIVNLMELGINILGQYGEAGVVQLENNIKNIIQSKQADKNSIMVFMHMARGDGSFYGVGLLQQRLQKFIAGFQTIESQKMNTYNAKDYKRGINKMLMYLKANGCIDYEVGEALKLLYNIS